MAAAPDAPETFAPEPFLDAPLDAPSDAPLHAGGTWGASGVGVSSGCAVGPWVAEVVAVCGVFAS